MRTIGWAALVLGGCDRYELLGDLGDTGWFEDSATAACTAVMTGAKPNRGDGDWFREDPLLLEFEGGTERVTVRLLDRARREVAITTAVGETGFLVVTPDAPLEPAQSYTLMVTDCVTTTEIGFGTSVLGLPIIGGGQSLLGRTYELGLADPGLNWLEPAGFGALLGSFFETPILVGVQWVDGPSLAFLGGQGAVDQGEITQDLGYATWSLPPSVFDAPSFSVQAPSVNLVVSGYSLPISDFELRGTFAPDGTWFGGGVLRGLGDTRYTGGALGNPNAPGLLCDLAAGIGVPCVACPDGEPYCLFVDVRGFVGREQPFTMVPVL